MRTRGVRSGWLILAAVVAGFGCGRTELDTRPWYDYDAGRPLPDVEPDVPDVPDVEPDVPDVPDGAPDVVEDEGTIIDVPVDTGPDVVVMSCMSAAMCMVCCGSDIMCQLGCSTEADPGSRDEIMAIAACVMGTGCGSDIACIMEECSDAINACDGGSSGSGGCLSLAWCLVSSGCTGVTECADQGVCYQTCFGAARPEVMGAARDLVICVAGECMTSCASGLTSLDCIGCLATNCLLTLRGCIGL